MGFSIACTSYNTGVNYSLVPRPLPDFISQLWRKLRFYLTAVEKTQVFSTAARDKIWEWPGNEAIVYTPDMIQSEHLLHCYMYMCGSLLDQCFFSLCAGP